MCVCVCSVRVICLICLICLIDCGVQKVFMLLLYLFLMLSHVFSCFARIISHVCILCVCMCMCVCAFVCLIEPNNGAVFGG